MHLPHTATLMVPALARLCSAVSLGTTVYLSAQDLWPAAMSAVGVYLTEGAVRDATGTMDGRAYTGAEYSLWARDTSQFGLHLNLQFLLAQK